jgi:molecular chaperone Hsp33
MNDSINQSDLKRRFVFDDADVRGCYARLDESCKTIQSTHYYPNSLARLINEFTIAAVLLKDSIKSDGSLTVQMRTESDINLLIADCANDGSVRAICEYDHSAVLPDEIILNHLPGAVLAVTITPDDGDRYQSIIPVEHGSLAMCLEDYFERSEQLPSRFNLLATAEKAVGFSLHALPAQHIKDIALSEQRFEHLDVLLKSMTLEEAHADTSADALTKLYHDESCRLFDVKSLQFGCECSTERSLNALKALGEEELRDLVAEHKAEDKDAVTVDCHFCFQRYLISFEQIDTLFSEILQ